MKRKIQIDTSVERAFKSCSNFNSAWDLSKQLFNDQKAAELTSHQSQDHQLLVQGLEMDETFE